MVLCISYIWLFSILIKLSGDVEENLGPKPNSCRSFSICQWNINSVSAHNFSEVFLLIAYISVHKFDVICISETFPNSDTAHDDDNLKIEGYNIACIVLQVLMGIKLYNYISLYRLPTQNPLIYLISLQII